MDTFLDQIDRACKQGLPFLAFYSALTIPSICCALESEDGEDKGDRYVKWFDENVGCKYTHKIGFQPFKQPEWMEKMNPEEINNNSSSTSHKFLTGQDCYYFRCSVLHQGRSSNPKSRFSRVVFCNPTDNFATHCSQHNDILFLDVEKFCTDITSVARSWLQSMRGTQPFDTNYAKLMRPRKEIMKGFCNLPLDLIY